MKRSNNSQRTSSSVSCVRVKGLLLLVCIALLPSSGWGYTGGLGTLQVPYQISTPEDLMQLSQSPKDYDKHFLLGNDIDLAGYSFTQAVIAPYEKDYVSRFNQDNTFAGSINGNGHVIRHLTITGSNNLGLIGVLSATGQVFGLGIVDANIVGTGRNAAMLAGYNAGCIRQCFASGTVLGNDQVGGLVGENDEGSIENCFVTGQVSGETQVGGLVGGGFQSLLLNAYSTCRIHSETGISGGLVSSPVGDTLNSFWDIETSGIPEEPTGSSGGMGGGAMGGGAMGGGAMGGGGFGGGAMGGGGLVGGQPVVSAGVPGTGTGLSTALMQDKQTFLKAGWDFQGETANGSADVWMMPEADAYPVLSVFYGIAPILPFDHGIALGRCLLSEEPREVIWNGAELFDVNWDHVAVTQITKNSDRYPDLDPNARESVISLSGSLAVLGATHLVGMDTRTGVVCQVLDEQGAAVPLKEPLSPFDPAFCWDILSPITSPFELQIQTDPGQPLPSHLSQVDFYVYALCSDLVVTLDVPFETMDTWMNLVPGFNVMIKEITVEEGQWEYTLEERRWLESGVPGVLIPGTTYCEQTGDPITSSMKLTDVDVIFHSEAIDSAGQSASPGNHGSSSSQSARGLHMTEIKRGGTGPCNIAAIRYVVALNPHMRIVPLTLTDIPVSGF